MSAQRCHLAVEVHGGQRDRVLKKFPFPEGMFAARQHAKKAALRRDDNIFLSIMCKNGKRIRHRDVQVCYPVGTRARCEPFSVRRS